jgi:chorismate mutase/prephenate dehydratase
MQTEQNEAQGAADAMRGEMKEIDAEIANLFRRRMEIVGKSAAISGAGAATFGPAYERDTLARATEIAGSGMERDARALFTTMFGIASARRRAIANGEAPIAESVRRTAAAGVPFPDRAFVACPGADGSYAQQAVSQMFKIPTILFMRDFESVFEMVEKGMCPYGILPIENSSAGSVAQVYDLMVKHRFHIVRSTRVKVSHVLLGRRGATLDGIREIASHPHALAQCGTFLKSRRDTRTVPAANTAVAAKELAENGPDWRAVVASRACADLYGLEILAEGISDTPFNYTRFICISRKMEITPDADKFSIMLTLPHRPGSLNAIISKFAAAGVNLTKLESRPIPGMDFEFRFTFEFESSPTDPDVLALLSELSQDPEIEGFTFLGSYA